MSISADTFNAVYGAMTEAQATATFGRQVVPRCMIVSAQRQRANGEYGPGQDIVATLRFLASDATAAGVTAASMALGQEVSVLRSGRGETKAVKYRIGASRETGDIVAMGLEDVAQ